MKKPLLCGLANLLFFVSLAQNHWQQKLAYTIAVTVNDREKTLDGFEKLVYTNHSPDTLYYIWFHLWPNAYKNDRTAFSEQLLRNGNTDFYFAPKEKRGYINRLSFQVNGTTTQTEDHPEHIDIIKVLLPQPLPPDGTTEITTPFHVKLPFLFTRSGYDEQAFQVSHWYPKPAVYDAQGWHPMPYLDQGGFYSEFGSYDVQITLPKEYVVAATGILQDTTEMNWAKSREPITAPQKASIKASTANKRKGINKSSDSLEIYTTKTLRYTQDNIHDFAFVANKHYVVRTDTAQMPSGQAIHVAAYYKPGEQNSWQHAVNFTKEALRFYTSQVGPYPYSVVSIAQGWGTGECSMESPTLVVAAPTNSAEKLDAAIAHQIGHNWFSGALASNKRMHPWMNEGFNSFYERRYIKTKYGHLSRQAEALLLQTTHQKKDQPIATPSENFSTRNYKLIAHYKTAEWLQYIEQQMGKEAFRQMMQHYYYAWKFSHPQPDDFRKALENQVKENQQEVWSYLDKEGLLPSQELHGTTLLTPFTKGSFRKAWQSPAKNLLTFLPAAGFNVYDQFQVGALATNYGSIGNRFTFAAVPLYATGSRSLTGLGEMRYSIPSQGTIRKTDFFIGGASFHHDEFTSSDNKRQPLRFAKLVPGVRLTLNEKSPLSTITRFVQWKTFLIREEGLQITTDSVISPADTVVRFNFNRSPNSRYLNQLQWGIQNDRVLYPFAAIFQVEQATDFIRTTFTGNYFFNYAKGGGLSVRFFAGHFQYINGKTVQKQFANEPYHLNLTGPKGYEDYTYSNYFIGRSRFDGISSQQIIIRDGAFKVRTDMLSQKVGKTDNWLSALNLVTTVPDGLNPLSILPFQIPLRLFADVGTYAEAWDRSNSVDRFVVDAGLQFSFLHQAVNVYVPLLYSSVFRNYIKSTLSNNRLLKTISFSIDLNHRQWQKVKNEVSLQ